MKTIKTKTNVISYNSDIFDIIDSRIVAQNNGATVFVPHICNNINLFGAGFAAAVAKHYPLVKENFHLLGNKARLGYVQYVMADHNKNTGHRLIFANMIAQNKVINDNNLRPLNYEFLVKCMIDVREHINNMSKSYEEKIEIHCPKFGSGLAGGNWNFINDLINDIWSDINVFIYGIK